MDLHRVGIRLGAEARLVLRTLHVTNAWHPSSGGIGTFYRALLDTANSIGWQARLVVPSHDTRFEPVGSYAGIYHVKAPHAPINTAYRIFYPHRYLLPGSPLRHILRIEQPHVVEVNDKYSLPYLAGLLRLGAMPELKHRAAIVGISCERFDETVAAYTGMPRASTFIARAFMKCIYFPQCDAHIAVSRHTARELEIASRGHKVTRGVWIRGMGVDAARFHPERRSARVREVLLRKAGAAPDTTLLLYAGRLAPEKNLPLLLDTMDRLSANCMLLIAGDGPDRETFLEDARRRAPGRVVHLDHESDRDRLADLFANVDIFLHPNPREPFGIAPLEAMAAGVALVAPNSGGVTAYANNRNAWVTAPTGQAFADAITQILGDPAERSLRTLAARETAVDLAWPQVCETFHDLYRDLYAQIQGRPAQCQPAFYSTPGNWLGFETAETTSS